MTVDLIGPSHERHIPLALRKPNVDRAVCRPSTVHTNKGALPFLIAEMRFELCIPC